MQSISVRRSRLLHRFIVDPDVQAEVTRESPNGRAGPEADHGRSFRFGEAAAGSFTNGRFLATKRPDVGQTDIFEGHFSSRRLPPGGSGPRSTRHSLTAVALVRAETEGGCHSPALSGSRRRQPQNARAGVPYHAEVRERRRL